MFVDELTANVSYVSYVESFEGPLSDVIAIVFGVGLFGLACFASIGGLGGAFIVPAIFLVRNDTPFAECSALSLVVIFGLGLGNVLYFGIEQCLGGKRPTIDFELGLLVEPIFLAGATVGGLLIAILPSWICKAIFVVVVMVSSVTTLRKGLKLFMSESDSKGMEKIKLRLTSGDVEELEDEPTTSEESELETEKTETETETEIETETETETEILTEIETETETESSTATAESETVTGTVPSLRVRLAKVYKLFPLHVIIPLICSWLLILFSKLIMGSSKTESVVGLKVCGAGYWAVFTITFMVLCLISCMWAPLFFQFRKNIFENEKIPVAGKTETLEKRLYKYFLKKDLYNEELEAKTKDAMAIDEAEETVVRLWNLQKELPFTAALFFAAGIVTAFEFDGIGGGMLQNPIFFLFSNTLNIPPEVVIATSCFLVFFTDSSSTAINMITGVIEWKDYDFVFLVFYGLAISGFGRSVQRILQRWRMSIIVLICGLSILAGGVVSIIVNAWRIYEDIAENGYNVFWEFGSPC